MRRLVVALCLCLLASVASAAPTPKNSQLLWDDYTDPDGVGYFLYWAKESEPLPRLYDNTRRTDIGANASETIITASLTAVNVKGKMCFKLTAYDLAKNESDFSNEACGFFGVTGPKGLKAA